MAAVDIREVRRRNLKRVVESRFGGNVAKFSRTVARQASFFNDLFAEPPRKKSFGEKLARGLERALALSAGSLDEPLDGQQSPATTAPRPRPEWPFGFDYKRFDRLSPEDKHRVEGAALMVILEIEGHQNAVRKRRKTG